MASTTTKTICLRLSNEQLEIMRQHTPNESDSDYLRRLIAEDMQRQGIEWPGYVWVSNEDRKRNKLERQNA